MMKRHSSKTTILALACVFALLVIGTSRRLVSLAEAQARPNIIVILADDLGYSDLSCYTAKSTRR